MKIKNNKKILKQITLINFFVMLIFSIFTFFVTKFAKADIIVCDDMKNGFCSVNNIVETAIKIADFLLGIVAGVALLFFVVAGIMMIISGGQQEKIAKGKSMMINSVIGLVICVLSWVTVYFVQTAIGVNQTLGNVPSYTVTTPDDLVFPCAEDPINWYCRQKHPNVGAVCRHMTKKQGNKNFEDKHCWKKLCPVKDTTTEVVWCCDKTVSDGTEFKSSDDKCYWDTTKLDENEKCIFTGKCTRW